MADGVAERIVPFAERHAELSGAPALISHVPGFHDEFEVAEQHVAAQGVQERVVFGEITVEAGERCRQVEAESVDADSFGPVSQAVDGEGDDVGVGEVEGVAAAGGVFEPSGIVVLMPVVGQFVQSAPAYRRAVDSAFACVVVDHVHDDFESGFVKGADHIDDFLADCSGAGALCGFGGVGRFGGEVSECRISPIVVSSALLEEQLVLFRLDGQQLDGGDAEGLQVGQGGGVGESCVGAS